MKTAYIFMLLALFLTPAAANGQGFVSLMPKRDVTEHWIVDGKAPKEIWSVRDRAIACTGQPNGFLRSRKSYRNFILRAEWRFQEGWDSKPGSGEWPNAGFFIHAGPVVNGWPTSFEVQGHYGEAGSLFGVRGGKISGAKRGPFVKDRPPFGSWDKYEITSWDGKVTVVLNGVQVNEGIDAQPREGNICLQSEGWPVYYRNVEIKALP